MSKLVITRGLPASGKTTYAREWVKENRANRARVNRDDIRQMLDQGDFIKGVTEPRVLLARDSLITSYLRKGVDVICDDTNLPSRTVRDLAKLAAKANAEFQVVDLTNVPPQTCASRNSTRINSLKVPDEVIWDMYDRFIQGRGYPLDVPVLDAEQLLAGDLYLAPPDKPAAILVDIDGTLAHMNGRSPFDESRVLEDKVDPVVAEIVVDQRPYRRVILMSGRTETCRKDTERWLYLNDIPYDELYMRRAGDARKDSVVKRELFDAHVRYRFAVRFVLDDRNQVVQMWRSLGLKVLQVAEGEF